MALFFFTKKHLALYVEHQLVYISQTIISPLSLCKIILVFFMCVRACVRACVHIYIYYIYKYIYYIYIYYIYIYIYAGNESPGSAKSYTNVFIIMEVMAFY